MQEIQYKPSSFSLIDYRLVSRLYYGICICICIEAMISRCLTVRWPSGLRRCTQVSTCPPAKVGCDLHYLRMRGFDSHSNQIFYCICCDISSQPHDLQMMMMMRMWVCIFRLVIRSLQGLKSIWKESSFSLIASYCGSIMYLYLVYV